MRDDAVYEDEEDRLGDEEEVLLYWNVEDAADNAPFWIAPTFVREDELGIRSVAFLLSPRPAELTLSHGVVHIVACWHQHDVSVWSALTERDAPRSTAISS